MSNSTRTIDVLLKEVVDPALRSQLADAIDALRKQTRFGLVFEKHHPEVSRLPEVKVRKGLLVARCNEKETFFTASRTSRRERHYVCLKKSLLPLATISLRMR